MAYNKARAEREWLKWKEAEERKLRELGVDEETIQCLHTYDWEEFNRERRHLQHWADWIPDMEQVPAQEVELPIGNVESLLDSIENAKLLRILLKEDKLTLGMVLMRMEGYSSKEIAAALETEEYVITMRIYRLRKKLKKYF